MDAERLTPSAFILALPKAELHLHLEGAVQPRTLVELSRRHDAGPLTLQQVEALYRYQDFTGFMMAFKAVSERLRTAEDYELITYELMRQLAAENVVHAEVYISAGIVHWRKQEFGPILAGAERGRARGEKDFGVSLLWIIDAVRHFGPEKVQRVFEDAARYRSASVAGVGIGGDERQAAPELFREQYAYARQQGLRLTCHAGETVGPESIWGALNLGAERIGHGLTAWQDRELMAVLVERQVPVELCVTSNLRTSCCASLEQHPLKNYFELGVMVTLNSDDPAMFRTSLAREYALAQAAFELSDEHLRELARNSFEASFLPAERKLAFLRQVDTFPG
ncbi:MAG: adenosine deaminase [Candidatus Koribacter versatilis]|uniref:Adenosine deaminase n=1 Tax=Candidatus Korobacter versatilis TaxID=658062 RepID=A0A932ENX3_9BACT|nr:adenosine deaminase [Candidatus Koribacter versatilis]